MDEKTKDTSEETTEEDVEEAPEPIEGEEEETTEDESSSTIDYESITKEEEDRKADPDKAQEAFEKRKEKRDEEDGEKPPTIAQISELIDGKIQSSQQTTNKTLLENNAVTIAGTLAESTEEANAILATWKKRGFPEEMPLHEQLKETQYIVSGKRNISKNSEMARALKAKDNVSKDTAGTHRDAPEGDVPKLSSADATALKQVGYKWDGVKRVWFKHVGRNQRMETKGPGQKPIFVDR